jgi:hypothetical protein
MPGSSPFSAKHSIIEQNNACGNLVAQSSASSTVSAPERSALCTASQSLSKSMPRSPDAVRLDRTDAISVGLEEQATLRTGEVDREDRVRGAAFGRSET